MKLDSLNKFTSGFKNNEMSVIASHRKTPITMSYIDCKYGHIVHQFMSESPRYSLDYGIYEVDIEYTQNEFDYGYILKAALYRRDEIIKFENLECNSLRMGLIQVTEKLIDEFDI